jgi:Phage integrase family
MRRCLTILAKNGPSDDANCGKAVREGVCVSHRTWLGAAVSVEEARGKHPEFVFTYRGHLVQRINNNGWRCARRSVGLTQVRVHDLKHTYGRRLRAVGVPLETRRVLLGYKNSEITTH